MWGLFDAEDSVGAGGTSPLKQCRRGAIKMPAQSAALPLHSVAASAVALGAPLAASELDGDGIGASAGRGWSALQASKAQSASRRPQLRTWHEWFRQRRMQLAE